MKDALRQIKKSHANWTSACAKAGDIGSDIQTSHVNFSQRRARRPTLTSVQLAAKRKAWGIVSLGPNSKVLALKRANQILRTHLWPRCGIINEIHLVHSPLIFLM